MHDEKKSLALSVVGSFSYLVVWQAIGFLILLLLVWFNEVTDVPALVAGKPPSPPDLIRGCIASAGVLISAIISIGQTYLQQRNIVSGMLTICCYCHRIRIDQVAWQRIEEYIGRHSTALFSHGICPECFDRAAGEIGSKEASTPACSPEA